MVKCYLPDREDPPVRSERVNVRWQIPLWLPLLVLIVVVLVLVYVTVRRRKSRPDDK